MAKSVYITKYALTKGIQKCEVRGDCDSKKAVVTVVWEGGLNGVAYFHKPYWHTTKEDAVIHARFMRDNKVASMRRQMEKLHNLEFDL